MLEILTTGKQVVGSSPTPLPDPDYDDTGNYYNPPMDGGFWEKHLTRTGIILYNTHDTDPVYYSDKDDVAASNGFILPAKASITLEVTAGQPLYLIRGGSEDVEIRFLEGIRAD